MQALSDEQRLASLEKKIDDGFAEMRTEFRAVRGELNDVRTEIHAEFKAVRGETQEEFKAVRAEVHDDFKASRDEVSDEFKAARAEQSALVRMLIQIIGGTCAALASGFLALVVSHL
jgi:molecular chaperone GrpE (heat shock protein)